MVYVVYHGTSLDNLESIERDGLRPSRSYGGDYNEPTVSTYRGLAGLYAVNWGARESGVVIEYHIPDSLVDEYLYPAETVGTLGSAHGLRKPLPPKFIAQKFRVFPGSTFRGFPEYRPMRRPEVHVRNHRRRSPR